MTDHTDVREFLRHMADEVPSSPVEPRPAVRRAKRRLVRTLSAATLVLAAIAAGSAVGIGRLTAAPPSVPAHPGPSFLPAYHHNGEVVVYGFFGHKYSVVAVDPVTGHQHVLPITGVSGWPQSPTVLAWSPDGSQLAYTVRDEVRILSARSGSSRRIATCNAPSAYSSGGRQQCTGLAWSPDGSTIAVGQVSSSLLLIGPNGHIRATLIPKPGWIVGDPAWSPDGSRIAFGAGNDPLGGHASSLFVMNRDGSDLRLLVARVWGAPDWSPDGKKIAYLRGEPVKDGSGDSEVIVSMIDSDGSNPVQVMRAGRCACVGFSPGLTWSPDGTKLAIVTATMPDGRGGLATVNADGTDLRFLAASGWGSPAWRPVP